MLEFITAIAACGILYFAWQITDQLPDIVFRLGEIQRDIAEIRRNQERDAGANSSTPPRTPT